MGRILVAEDSPAVNDLLVDILTGAGHECLRAFDGAQALEILAGSAPDAVVLDLNLPKIHGLEVLGRVKRDSPATVVVVITGHESKQTALAALKLGADEYLRKPVPKARLLESLAKGLTRAEGEKRARSRGIGACDAAEADLAELFFDAPAALVSADREGTIRAFNRAFVRLVGRNPEELLGRPLEELVSPEVRSTWMAAVREEARSPRGYQGEIFHDGRLTDPVPVAVTAAERSERGDLVFAVRDLRRQKALEEHFFESRKLASLGRVVAGVAHEVRNPLIAIGGFARKLRRDAADGTKQEQYLGVILSEVQRLEKMVRDIEAYVEFTSRRKTSFARVKLDEVLAEAVTSVRERFPDWEGRVLLDNRTVPSIYADRALLRDLFEGLVENAFDAMPRGGHLSITSEAAGNWVRVRVGDSGRGISQEDLEAVFDPFFTSKTQGAGLGLAKAHMIVEEHSGTIEFDSQVGKGTVCTVSLPIDRRRVPRAAA